MLAAATRWSHSAFSCLVSRPSKTAPEKLVVNIFHCDAFRAAMLDAHLLRTRHVADGTSMSSSTVCMAASARLPAAVLLLQSLVSRSHRSVVLAMPMYTQCMGSGTVMR